MLKRIFDIFFALVGLLILFPLLLIIGILIKLDSKGPIFFRQERIGRNKIPFYLFKFRSMKVDAEKLGQLTVGGRDPRVTRMGYFIRKFKLDEFPQFINILNGDMSFVGPRPEVKCYVDLYSQEQLRVLEVKPGLTDYASIKYMDENEILAAAKDPEKAYIEEVMPDKLKLNLKYVEEQGLITDVKIILQTVYKIFR